MASSFQASSQEPSWERSGPHPGYYRLPKKEIFSYSLIDLAMNLVFGTVMMYLTFFYTDVFGLLPGHVATIFLISRLWDAVNDPLMGWIVERTKPRGGKYKPWIVYAAVPFGVAAVLTYMTPALSYPAKVVWALATYNILNMLFTVIIQPYASLATVMTADPDQRTRLQSIRLMMAQTGGVVVALAIPLLSDWLANFMSLQMAYTVAIGLLSLLMVALLLYAGSQVVERIESTSHQDPPSLKELFVQAIKNKYVIVLFLLFFGVYAFNTLQTASAVYYMTYFAMRPDLVAWFATITVLPSVFAVPMVPWMIRHLRKRGTVLLGLGLGILGAVVLSFLSADAFALMMLARGISSFGYGILMGSLWAIITDAVEYGDLRTGRRLPAIIITLIGLGLKFSMMIGGAVPAWILQATNYDAELTEQTAEAVGGIHFMTTWLPALILIVTFVIFFFAYDLTEEKVSRIQHQLAIRDGVLPPQDEEEQALAEQGRMLRDEATARAASRREPRGSASEHE